MSACFSLHLQASFLLSEVMTHLLPQLLSQDAVTLTVHRVTAAGWSGSRGWEHNDAEVLAVLKRVLAMDSNHTLSTRGSPTLDRLHVTVK